MSLDKRANKACGVEVSGTSWIIIYYSAIYICRGFLITLKGNGYNDSKLLLVSNLFYVILKRTLGSNFDPL